MNQQAEASHINIPSGAPLAQETSPLFSLLPAEIRNPIFALTLAPYEDPWDAFIPNYLYLRPDHQRERRSSIALLQTCRRVYIEARCYSWGQSEHLLFLRHDEHGRFHCGRDNHQAVRRLQFFARAAAAPYPTAEFAQLRIFTKAHKHFWSTRMQPLFADPVIRPRRVIISMRMTGSPDNWDFGWPARIDDPTQSDRFWPDSVTDLLVQLETLRYHEAKVLLLAKHVAAAWVFVGKDGTSRLAVQDPQRDIKLTHWLGVSISESPREPQDGCGNAEDFCEYTVATVQFSPTESRKMPDTTPRTYAAVVRGWPT